MSSPTLEPEELDAIRAAIQQAQPSAGATPRGEAEASPIAIIADDRAAERARPNGLRVATRWARLVEKQLARVSGTRTAVTVVGVETVDGAAMRAQTAEAWLEAVTFADDESGVLAVSGPIVEALVARLLGDTTGAEPAPGRAPSPVALRLFRPAGAAIVTALVDAWRDELGTRLRVAAPAPPTPGGPAMSIAQAWRHRLPDPDLVLVVTLATTTPSGVIRLAARPEAIAGPSVTPARSAVAPALIEAALGAVPVDVRVELGRARVTMAELASLEVGAVIPLDRLVDDLVPVAVAGVIKAHGKPIASRGAMAIEIVSTEPAPARGPEEPHE